MKKTLTEQKDTKRTVSGTKCKKGEYYAIARVQIICPEGITYEQVIGLLPK